MLARRAFALLCLLAIAGCMASAPRAATAPDLAGAWDFTVDLGTSTTPGSMTLVRSGEMWTDEVIYHGGRRYPMVVTRRRAQ